MARKKKMSWWTPGWSYLPQTGKLFRKVITPGFFMRIIAVSVGIITIMALVVRRLAPDVEFDWVKYGAIAIAVGLGAQLLNMLGMLLPTRISVKKRGIALSHSSYHLIRYRDLTGLNVDVSDRSRPFLVILMNEKAHLFGIPEKLDMELLIELLKEYSGTDVEVITEAEEAGHLVETSDEN